MQMENTNGTENILTNFINWRFRLMQKKTNGKTKTKNCWFLFCVIETYQAINKFLKLIILYLIEKKRDIALKSYKNFDLNEMIGERNCNRN